MNEQEKLFDLILWTDETTVALRRLLPEEEYKEFRAKHYENMKFIAAAGLKEEYYNYMFDHYNRQLLERFEEKKDG